MATGHAALRKRAERDALIQQAEAELGVFTDADESFVKASAVEIVENMGNSKQGWSAERVMQAFIRSAIKAHAQTNCLTEIMFDQALTHARALDARYQDTGKLQGLLHGLPVSFKDTYNVLGKDSSLGCSMHTEKPTTDPSEESTLVKITRQAGGIPFCKTNVPQTLLAFECSNPVFGRTLNPHADARTSGGSTGGEAALLALNGSALGWGSDIGGSVRIPASYSGIYGLKTVQGRIPVFGGRSSNPGFEGIRSSTGPMARSIQDLELACRVVSEATCRDDMKLHGEQLVRIPWRDQTLPSKLVVGWYVEDDCIKTSPACARAVQEAVEAMRAAGHQVREFKPQDVWQALQAFVALTSADGYETLLANRGSDPLEPSLKLVTLGPKLPSLLRWLISWIVLNVLGDWLFAAIFSESRKKSVQEYHQWAAKRERYARKFRQAAWEEQGFDMIICPVQAIPAIEHGKTKLLSPLCVATVLYNVADSTVGVIPVTKVDSETDALPSDFLTHAKGSKLLNKRVYLGADAAYDAKKMHGLPVGIQVVGRPWEEEKVLAMMGQVEKALGR